MRIYLDGSCFQIYFFSFQYKFIRSLAINPNSRIGGWHLFDFSGKVLCDNLLYFLITWNEPICILIFCREIIRWRGSREINSILIRLILTNKVIEQWGCSLCCNQEESFCFLIERSSMANSRESELPFESSDRSM